MACATRVTAASIARQGGQLVTADGAPVLSAAGKTIAVPPGEPSVGANGVLSVAGGVVATIGVFTFPAGANLTPEGANRYIAPAGVDPKPATEARFIRGRSSRPIRTSSTER